MRRYTYAHFARRHPTFTFVAAGSVLLGLCVLCLLIRSSWQIDYWAIPTSDPPDDPGGPLSPAYEFMSYQGSLQIAWTRDQLLLKELLGNHGDIETRCDELVYFERAPAKVVLIDRARTTEWLTPSVLSGDEGFAGFAYRSRYEVTHQFHLDDPVVLYGRVVKMPEWVLLVLAIPLPMIWRLKLILARRAVRRGACILCGYDLRASSDRCPECGEKIVVKAQRTEFPLLKPL